MEVVVRPANAGDVDAVADLLVHLYEAEAPRIVSGNRAGCLELVAHSLRRTNPDLTDGRVVEVGGRVIAYGAIAPADCPRRPARQEGVLTICRTLGFGAALRYLVGIKRLMLRVCARLPAGVGQIHSIVVHPAFRGLGFARRLVRCLEDELCRAGARSIMLYVLEGNDVVGMYANSATAGFPAATGPSTWSSTQVF
jgi:ribosomal protein S18 acetylase RimI-like enzyme